MSLREEIMLEVAVVERGLDTEVEADFLWVEATELYQFWLRLESATPMAESVYRTSWDTAEPEGDIMTQVDQILDEVVTKYVAATEHVFNDPGPAGVIKRDWEIWQRDTTTWCIGPDPDATPVAYTVKEEEAQEIADSHNEDVV
jgi:hypothetical protein